jgi:putative transposase
LGLALSLLVELVLGTAHREAPNGSRLAPKGIPRQNPNAERLVGSIRRECPDHILVLNESCLRRILKAYFQYYLHSRTHLALAKDAPEPRAIQLSELGAVVEIPEVDGLHHRYERRAA